MIEKLDRVLWSGDYIETRLKVLPKLGTTYEYLHEKKCKGLGVALLPFRQFFQIEYLLRQEIIPAWGMVPKHCSVTGMVDEGEDVVLAALRELSEETGYHIDKNEIIVLGNSRLGKSCDTSVFLFSADLTNSRRGKSKPDGSILEKFGKAQWGESDDVVRISDPLVHVMYNRLQVMFHSRIYIREELFDSPESRERVM